MKCKDCTESHCGYRTSDSEKECYYSAYAYDVRSNVPPEEQHMIKPFDIDFDSNGRQFRRDTAARVLAAIVSNSKFNEDTDLDALATISVNIADALWNKIKEKEEVK